MPALGRALIFSPQGVQLAEVEPELESVVWRLNGVGPARFTLAWSDPKCTPTNLRFGNRLLLQFSNGLPDWAGVIDLPRQRLEGAVVSTAYSGEQVLDWRVTDKGRYFNAMAPGYIFRSLLTEENAEFPTGIEIGAIYEGGVHRTLEYHYHDLLERVKDLARLTGNDFSVTPEYIGGYLRLKANWHESRGADKSGQVWLVDGANVVEATLDEQGNLANHVIFIGQGTTWGSERLDAVVNHLSSQQLYDYREYAEVQTGVSQLSTLRADAEAILAARAWPTNRITITASDNPPGRFVEYDVGDIVRAMLHVRNPLWAFDGLVRVMARELKPDGGCRLEVEEWHAAEPSAVEAEWGS
jgi:hypothetical protein